MTKENKARLEWLVRWDNHAICANCGKTVYHLGTPQGAHIIKNTPNNIKKYGKGIIDSEPNVKMTCSLKCNGAIQATDKNDIERVFKLINEVIEERGYRPRPRFRR
jgi:hypothetical protein